METVKPRVHFLNMETRRHPPRVQDGGDCATRLFMCGACGLRKTETLEGGQLWLCYTVATFLCHGLVHGVHGSSAWCLYVDSFIRVLPGDRVPRTHWWSSSAGVFITIRPEADWGAGPACSSLSSNGSDGCVLWRSSVQLSFCID